MSLKQSTSKPDPRIAKREVMVTRHKSAQMKRQLRTKNRSMKHITDLLKSPAKETQSNSPKTVSPKTKSPLKLKQSLLKSVEKVQKLPEKVFKLSKVIRQKAVPVPDEEYYPNKRKRKVDVKKVSLKPSHELQMIGGIKGSVKRKCAVPHKVTSKLKSPKTSKFDLERSELSMAELIQMVEDELTDEDMMEILTCPSPVWWEDPPYEDYIEEAIFTRSPEPASNQNQKLEISEVKKTSQKQVSAEEIMAVDTPNDIKNSLTEQSIVIPNLERKSEKFLNKRSKLEGLLGNIKSKNGSKVNHTVRNVFSEDLVVLCTNYRKDNSVKNKNAKTDKVDKTTVNKDTKIDDNPKKNTKEAKSSVSESDDDIIFNDSSITEDDMLRDLENIIIPIENDKESDVIVIEDDDDEISDTASKNLLEAEFKLKTSDRSSVVPQSMPVLQKCDVRRKMASPKSIDSCSSKNSTTSNHDMDSISDTNVRFLLDDEIDEENDDIAGDNKNKEISSSYTQRDISKDVKDKPSNSMTIYKIIGEVDDSKTQEFKRVIEIKKEKDDDKSAVKINDYYKKCKKVNQKRQQKDRTDINKNDVKKIRVKVEDETAFMLCDTCKPKSRKVSSNEKNVYVCLSCSSISESVDCAYCIENSKSKGFTCTLCEIKFCCEVYYKKHAMEHRELDSMS